MNTPAAGFEPSLATAPTTLARVRPFYWSIRRELWEHRYVVIIPAIIAVCVSVGAVVRLFSSTLAPGAAFDAQRIAQLLSFAAALIMLASFLVGAFYSAEALHGERRDRSLLFFKSLPVSDTTAVLSKAAIPSLLLPLVAFGLSLIAVAVVSLAAKLLLVSRGMGAVPVWSEPSFLHRPVIMLYGLAAHAAWYLPIHAFLALVSVSARRLPLLWATLPWLALVALERLTFGSSDVLSFIGERVLGAMRAGFHPGGMIRSVADLDPLALLSSPGLWGGVLAAAALLSVATHLRRRSEPS